MSRPGWIPGEPAPLPAGVDPAGSGPCPFCHPRPDAVLARSQHALAIADAFPVSRGHTLIVPGDHVNSIFDLEPEARIDAWRLLDRVRRDLRSRIGPDGFNVGINDGPAAGQTVFHAHIHLIPRFRGDCQDPRGGVRAVLPQRARYWR